MLVYWSPRYFPVRIETAYRSMMPQANQCEDFFTLTRCSRRSQYPATAGGPAPPDLLTLEGARQLEDRGQRALACPPERRHQEQGRRELIQEFLADAAQQCPLDEVPAMRSEDHEIGGPVGQFPKQRLHRMPDPDDPVGLHGTDPG